MYLICSQLNSSLGTQVYRINLACSNCLQCDLTNAIKHSHLKTSFPPIYYGSPKRPLFWLYQNSHTGFTFKLLGEVCLFLSTDIWTPTSVLLNQTARVGSCTSNLEVWRSLVSGKEATITSRRQELKPLYVYNTYICTYIYILFVYINPYLYIHI